MKTLLVISALLTIVIAIAHSWLGERYIVRRLLRRNDLPRLFGDDMFTRTTIRFAWHLTTVAWWGLAVVLLLLTDCAKESSPENILFAVSATFLCSGILSLFFTRGRHLSWIVFLVISVLIFLAAR